MKSNQQMGERNYALASHSAKDKTILFSPLDPIVAATQDTSTELTGQNPTAATE